MAWFEIVSEGGLSLITGNEWSEDATDAIRFETRAEAEAMMEHLEGARYDPIIEKWDDCSECGLMFIATELETVNGKLVCFDCEDLGS